MSSGDMGTVMANLDMSDTRHNCGTAIKVRRTRLCSSRARYAVFSKCGCDAFVAFFLTRTVAVYSEGCQSFL